MRPLWAPWRLEYVQQADEEDGCIFCVAAGSVDEAGLVVARASNALVLMNKYPYAAGHLLVAPSRHVGGFDGLTESEILQIHLLAAEGQRALLETYGPHGFNLGWNLGRAAGAGVTDHVHLHVVPRWLGDTNFMPVLADVKVMPQHLTETRQRLAEAWPRRSRGAGA